MYADNQDGSLDRSLSLEQLHGVDPSFVHVAHDSGMIGADGRIPYQRFFNAFVTGWGYWSSLTADVNSIPLKDALALGSRMEQIDRRAPLQWKNTWDFDGKKRLKLPSEIFRELVNASSALHRISSRHPRFFYEVEAHFSALLKQEAKEGKKEDVIHNPDVLLERALRETLNMLVEKKFLSVQERNALLIKCDRLSLYEEISDEEAREHVNRLRAALAYKSMYVFPAVEDHLWGEDLTGVNLSHEFVYQAGLLGAFEFMGMNPFVLAEKNSSTNGAHYDRQLYLPTKGVHDDLYQPALSVSDDILAHELAHAVFGRGYERTWEEWVCDWGDPCSGKKTMDDVIDFFAGLSEREYQNVFGTLYGHMKGKVVSGEYDERNEIHSMLATLTEVGYPFAEITRDRLMQQHGWSEQDANTVRETLRTYRSLIERAWGFRGHPAWAHHYRPRVTR